MEETLPNYPGVQGNIEYTSYILLFLIIIFFKAKIYIYWPEDIPKIFTKWFKTELAFNFLIIIFKIKDLHILAGGYAEICHKII